jgi:hypothetical protein
MISRAPFFLTPSQAIINAGIVGCQIESRAKGRDQEAAAKPKSAGNLTDLSSQAKRESS